MRSFFTDKNNEIYEASEGYIVIPWRPTDSRIPAFIKLINWYQTKFPKLEIILSDSGSDVFNLSGSRNIGIEKAFSKGAKYVVVSDADVFMSSAAMMDSINNTILNKTISNPYTTYINLSDQATLDFFNNDQNSIKKYSWIGVAPTVKNNKISDFNPCSGVNIIPKEVWEKIGGFDESFVGWGYEDNAYLLKYYNEYGRLYDFIDGLGISVSHKKEWKDLDDGRTNKRHFEKTYLNKI